mgnify:CR=1 FL=1
MKKLEILIGRNTIRISAVFILVAGVVLTVYTLHPTPYTLIPDAYAGISTTKHNLSAEYTSTIRATTIANICVFCHTPHSSSSAGPLWNHSTSSANYSVRSLPSGSYEGDTWRVTQAGQPDGSSKLCLGCHDGTIALGLLVNTPGSEVNPVGMTQTYMPCGPGNYSCLGTNFVTGGKHLDGPASSGDHLVSMEYNAALANELTTVKCPSGDTTQTLKWPLPAGPVKLYDTKHKYPPPDDTGTYKGVQCRSCHDPHEDTSPYKCFLVPVSGINCTGGADGCCSTNLGDNYDALCTTCHIACP